ncbi:MAG: serine/threonine-protein kinase [Deltaproteobacteria bacterium]|nr:serine/threonine-protein kinase [Deltaproteobacteria bacterium]
MSTDDVDSFIRNVASAPSVRPPLRVGDRLGDRYVIEARLGEGGMGTVYRAVDETLGEAVALKVVRGALDDAMLRDEVRLAQKVTHANVCRTFDLEELDGRHVIKMEYVAGETLAARLRRDGKLASAEAVRIARAIADGLAAAHARGIVHGDLKPANVMLDGERVVLMDFGVARVAAAPLDRVHGTPGYMAPEVLREERADARSDLYALGCILNEMVADAPRWLARATRLLLAKEATPRLAGLALLKRGPVSPLRYVAIVAAVAAVALVAWRLTRHAAWRPAIKDFPVFEENLDSLKFSPDGKWVVFGSTRSGPFRLYVMSPETSETHELALPASLGDVSVPSFTRDGRAILFGTPLAEGSGINGGLWRVPIAGSPPAVAGAPEHIASGFSISDCGDAYTVNVVGAGGWMIVLKDKASGRETLLYQGGPGQFVFDQGCDPSAQRIALFVSNMFATGRLVIVDRAGHAKTIIDDNTAAQATFASDGKSLIVSRRVAGKFQLYEVPVEGGVLRQLTFDDGPDHSPSVSPDGKYVSFTRDTSVFLPEISNGSAMRRLNSQRMNCVYLRAVTPDLVVGQRTADTGVEVVTIRIADGQVTRLALGSAPFPSFDHTTIYFIDPDHPDTLDAVPVGGGKVTAIAHFPVPLTYGVAGPDGLHVLGTRDRTMTGYRLAPDRIQSVEVDGGLVAVAPDGGWRAVTDLRTDPAVVHLVPPGASLDKPVKDLPTAVIHNEWLDAHRIATCLDAKCTTYDVTTGETTVLPGAAADLVASVMPDGRVLSAIMSAQVTEHLITNFAER